MAMVIIPLNDFVVGQKKVSCHKDIDAYPDLDYSIKNFSIFTGHVVFLVGPTDLVSIFTVILQQIPTITYLQIFQFVPPFGQYLIVIEA